MIEYHIYGKLKFEGLYSNENKNGKGKKYYFDGILKYEGEYLGGKRKVMEKIIIKMVN